jgi:ABC-type transport system involved in multi-copper enzyme maturation permease subunit
MSNKIFKSEVYKILNDKVFNILTVVAMAVNIVLAFGAVIYFNSWQLARGSANGTASIAIIGTILLFVAVMAVIFTAALSYIIPFRMFTIDYGNSLLQLSIASGTDRTKYYFTKFLVTFLRMLTIFVGTVLIPAIILIAAFGGNFTWLAGWLSAGTVWLLVLSSLIGYLSSLSLIYLSVVLVRGSLLSILVAIGINFVTGLVQSILQVTFSLATLSTVSSYSGTTPSQLGISWFAVLFALLLFVGYLLVGWVIFRKQDF